MSSNQHQHQYFSAPMMQQPQLNLNPNSNPNYYQYVQHKVGPVSAPEYEPTRTNYMPEYVQRPPPYYFSMPPPSSSSQSHSFSPNAQTHEKVQVQVEEVSSFQGFFTPSTPAPQSKPLPLWSNNNNIWTANSTTTTTSHSVVQNQKTTYSPSTSTLEGRFGGW